MRCLTFLSGSMRGRRFGLEREVVSIGREHSNDLSLDDPDVSRHHAQVFLKAGVHHLRDLGSTNGSRVNGALVSEAALRPGDQIAFGDTLLMYEERGETSPTGAVSFTDTSREDTSVLDLDPNEAKIFDPAVVRERPGAAERLARLYGFISEIAPVLSTERVVAELLSGALDATSADRAFAMMVGDSGHLAPAGLRLREGVDQSQEIKVSRTMTERVIETGRSVLSSDTLHDARFKDSVAFTGGRVSSFVCAPLRSRDKVLGILYTDTVGRSEPLTSDDLELVTAMALMAGAQYANAKLYSDLIDSAEYTQSILKCLHGGLVVVGNDGKTQRVNDSACELLGLRASELMGRSLGDFRQFAALWRIIDETRRSGIPVERDEIMIAVAGEEFPMSISSSLLRDHQNRVRGVVASFRSLKLLRQLSEQISRQQHLAAIGTMAASIAHEVRNPLNSIRGFAQLAQEVLGLEVEGEPDGEGRGPAREPGARAAPAPSAEALGRSGEYLGIIVSEVDRLGRLVQDLLDFSRQQEFAFVALDPARVVERALADLMPEFRGAGVETAVHVTPGVPAVRGNEQKLVQVLMNMARNALQAMASLPEGRERRLSVAVRPLMADPAAETHPRPRTQGALAEAGPLAFFDDGRHVRAVEIAVSDTGTGMDEATLRRVFEPFFTTRERGTGLGLPICQKIIGQHGGRIEAESRLGAGSVFRIELPPA